jgi:hypothetical protein
MKSEVKKKRQKMSLIRNGLYNILKNDCAVKSLNEIDYNE